MVSKHVSGKKDRYSHVYRNADCKLSNKFFVTGTLYIHELLTHLYRLSFVMICFIYSSLNLFKIKKCVVRWVRNDIPCNWIFKMVPSSFTLLYIFISQLELNRNLSGLSDKAWNKTLYSFKKNDRINDQLSASWNVFYVTRSTTCFK